MPSPSTRKMRRGAVASGKLSTFDGVSPQATLRTVSGEPRPDVEAAVAALAPFSSGLAADGYALEVSRSGSGGLRVKIVAGSDACEDCLIPREMFTGMLSSRLASQGVEFSELCLVYPAD